MSTTEMKIRLSADSRRAVGGFEATADAAAAAEREVRDFNVAAAEAEGGELERVLREQKSAFDAEAAAIRRGNVELRERVRQERALARQQRGAGGGRGGAVGGVLALGGRAGLVGAAAAVGAAGLAGGAVASEKGAAWEAAAARLEAVGADADVVLAGVAGLGERFGVEVEGLLAEAARLSKAGLSSERVVKAIEAAVVATRGDVAQCEGVLDALAESVSRGWIEEDLLAAFDKNGVGLRRLLMQRFDLSKEELEAALSAGRVDVEQYFSVLDELTGRGSEAQRAALAAAESTGGLVERLGRLWDGVVRDMGEGLNSFVVKPLAERALPVMEGLAQRVKGWMRGGGSAAAGGGAAVAGAGSVVEPWVSGLKGGGDDLRERLDLARAEEESVLFRGEAADVAARQREAAERARWGKMTLAARRAELGHRTGLGEGVSVKGVDGLIGGLSAELEGRAAAGGLVYGDDVKRLRGLEEARELLVVLEEQEAVAKRQRTLEEEGLAVADRRRAMLLAELEGDVRLLEGLEREAELEKRVAEYKRLGVEADEAAVMAAEELELERAVRLKRQEASQPQQEVRAGWLRSGLTNVGGGGVSLRQYESQGLKVAQDTAKNTRDAVTALHEVKDELKQQRGFAGFSVLG